MHSHLYIELSENAMRNVHAPGTNKKKTIQLKRKTTDYLISITYECCCYKKKSDIHFALVASKEKESFKMSNQK